MIFFGKKIVKGYEINKIATPEAGLSVILKNGDIFVEETSGVGKEKRYSNRCRCYGFIQTKREY